MRVQLMFLNFFVAGCKLGNIFEKNGFFFIKSLENCLKFVIVLVYFFVITI